MISFIPPWWHRPSLRVLLEALADPAETIRFVGGSVRDSLLGFPASDIDLATQQSPEMILEKASLAGLSTVSFGLSHGTVCVTVCKETFEITALRKDVETDGRRAKVSFTNDWFEDAKRRDFTFNALSLDLSGDLHDPFDGLKDLRGGSVRFIGDPKERIQEDRLRILRFFRFYGRFGRHPTPPSVMEIIRAESHALSALSKERLTQELKKILTLIDPQKALILMNKTRVSSELFGKPLKLNLLNNAVFLEKKYGFEPNWLLRLACLIEGSMLKIPAFLSLSKKEARSINLLREHKTLSNNILYLLHHYGSDLTKIILILRNTINPSDNLSSGLQIIKEWSPKKLPIDGHDLETLGYKGKSIGTELKKIENWWLEKNCLPSRNDCLKQIQEGQKKSVLKY